LHDLVRHYTSYPAVTASLARQLLSFVFSRRREKKALSRRRQLLGHSDGAMATPAHCLYCFECLAASLEHKELLPLRQVQEFWEQHKASHAEAADAEAEAPEVDVEPPPNIEDEIEEELSSLRENIKSNNALRVPGSSSGSSSSTPSSVSTSSSSRTPTSALGSSSNLSSNSFLPAVSRLPSSQSQSYPATQDEDKPLFVTWNTVSRSGSKTLRGCIGTFEAQELEHGLKNYALTS
jgi:AMME syndrome candidate gene 1 protein